MQIGFIGLGKMGLNMVTRLVRGGHAIVAYDRSADAVGRAQAAGAQGVASLDQLVSALAPPRAVWVMVPSGDATESTVTALAGSLTAGDTTTGPFEPPGCAGAALVRTNTVGNAPTTAAKIGFQDFIALLVDRVGHGSLLFDG